MLDDLAEYVVEFSQQPEEALGPTSQEADEMIDRMQQMEKQLRQYQKSNRAVTGYPNMVKQVWDELITMKSALVSIDERLVDLEEQQGADRIRLSSVLSGEYSKEGTEEFTVRYQKGTDVKLKIAGKTLIITVDPDSVYHLEEMIESDEEMMLEETDEESIDVIALVNEAVESEYMMWGVVGFFVLIAMYIIPTLLRRRKDDDLDGDFDDDENFLDEEEE